MVGGGVIDAVGVGGLGYAAAGIVAVSVLVGFVLMSVGAPAVVETQAVSAIEPEPAVDCAS